MTDDRHEQRIGELLRIQREEPNGLTSNELTELKRLCATDDLHERAVRAIDPRAAGRRVESP